MAVCNHDMNQYLEFPRYKVGLKAIICLNLLDAVFTMIWVIGGIAEEANPLMEYLLSESPAAFMCYKILIVHLCVGLLWRLRSRKFARIAITPALLTYIGIVAFHIHSFFAIVLRHPVL